MKIALKAFACLAALASLTGCAGSEQARALEGMIRRPCGGTGSWG